MNKLTITILLTLLFILAISVLGIESVKAQERAFTLTRSVIGSGGMGGSAGSYTLTSTLGQSVAGSVSSEDYTLTSGFWGQALMAWFDTFLPLLFR